MRPAATSLFPALTDFNPRTPCGVRLFCMPFASCSSKSISIHAPLAGCDARAPDRGRGGRISIHAPLAGCDQEQIRCNHGYPISIHAPLAGCDVAFLVAAWHNGQFQSTHPLRGATVQRQHQHQPALHFNPRTPCGVRLTRRPSSARRCGFQSTHPLRGATENRRRRDMKELFQSTHPLRGATPPRCW